MKKFVLTLLALLVALPVYAKDPIRTVEGIITKVSDGDTVHLNDDLGTKLKIRLYGIDAPETDKENRETGRVSKSGQPFGYEAWKALQDKVLSKRVKVVILDIDKYKRSVGIITLNDRNINQEMVDEGWAWAYRKYLDRPHASEYIQAEEVARSKRLGLWREGNPQPPWEFRKRGTQ